MSLVGIVVRTRVLLLCFVKANKKQETVVRNDKRVRLDNHQQIRRNLSLPARVQSGGDEGGVSGRRRASGACVSVSATL